MQEFIVSYISLHLSVYVSALSIFTFQRLWHPVTLYCKRMGMWNHFSRLTKPHTALDLPLLMYTMHRTACL